MYKRAKIDLDRSVKTFKFRNLGLDHLIGDNKIFFDIFKNTITIIS